MKTSQTIDTSYSARRKVKEGEAGQGCVLMFVSKLYLQGVLELVMSAYLAISIPPISLSLRSTLHCLLVGEHAVYEPVRHYLITSVPLFAALAIALLFPQVIAVQPLDNSKWKDICQVQWCREHMGRG